MLVAGAAGLEPKAMAKGALAGVSGGLIVAVPTALAAFALLVVGGTLGARSGAEEAASA